MASRKGVLANERVVLMAVPLKAYFGRRTLAFLDECVGCGKEYKENEERWHTVSTTYQKVDSWLLFCDECFKEVEKESGKVD